MKDINKFFEAICVQIFHMTLKLPSIQEVKTPAYRKIAYKNMSLPSNMTKASRVSFLWVYRQ